MGINKGHDPKDSRIEKRIHITNLRLRMLLTKSITYEQIMIDKCIRFEVK